MQPHRSDLNTKDYHNASGKFKDKSWKSYIKYASHLFGIVLFVVAVYVVQKEFKGLSINEIKTSLKQIPSLHLLMAGVCTFLSFLILSFYDKLAVIQVGHSLSFLKTAFAAFCSYVLSHNIGFSAISGAVVRFRLYGNWGLNALEIVQVIAFCSITYALGAAVLFGGLLIFKYDSLPLISAEFPSYLLIACGVLFWAFVFLYVILSFYCNELKIWKYRFPFPSPLMAVAQIVVATIEVIATAAIPYCVIPDHHLIPTYQPIDFSLFLGIYIASYTIGLVASVPGGAGVFDGAMLLALKPYMPTADIVCVIFVFRLFYYLIPLFFAGTMFAGHEIFMRGENALHKNSKRFFIFKLRPLSAANQNIRESDAEFSVTVAAAASSICGIMVLVLPVIDPIVDTQNSGILLFLEVISDYLLSFLGLILLTLVIALARRITMAWRLTVSILLILTVMTLVRGSPLYIPIILGLVTLFIILFRNCYYRTANFSAAPLSIKTVIEIFTLFITVYTIVWISPNHGANQGMIEVFLSQHVPFETKWVIAAMIFLGIVTLFKMMMPAKISFEPWSREIKEFYYKLADDTKRDLLPVKPDMLLTSNNKKAAIPFIRRNGFLVGIGDPVGSENEIINIIWRLRDLAMEENRSIAFVSVSQKYLWIYQDLQLIQVPYGNNGYYLCCEAYYTSYLSKFIAKRAEYKERAKKNLLT